MMHNDDIPTDPLYLAWCEAEFEMNCIDDELDGDLTDPRFIEACRKANIKLNAFLMHPTSSLDIILLKLEIACECEDFYTDAADPECMAAAPRPIVTAVRDLKYLIRYH